MTAVIYEPTSQKTHPGGLTEPPERRSTDNRNPSVDRLSSSLDPGTFSDEKQPLDPPDTTFRFRHHASEREQLLQALPSLDLKQSHIQRFEACGSNAWIQHSKSTNRVRVVAESCRLKWCPHCARARAKNVAESIQRLIETADVADWRFITLTARHSADPLDDQLAALKTAFRRLRQRKAWSDRVDYGLAVIHIEFNAKTDRWHPHLHLVVHGTWFPQQQLAKEWLSVTRNSMIVDIRSVWEADNAATYLAEYIGKPPGNVLQAGIARLREWIQANTAAKRIIRFGKPPQTKPPPEPDDGIADWEPIAKLSTILAAARAGDGYATHLVHLLTENDHESDFSAVKNVAPT